MTTAIQCLRELRAIEDKMSFQRIFYGVTLTLISITSVVSNILLLNVILLTEAMSRIFRLYLLSATSAGLVAEVAVLAALSPAIFLSIQLDDPFNIIISTTDTVGYLTLMFTTATIAVDRFLVFLLPNVHKYLNDTKVFMPFFAALPWGMAILLTVLMNINGCYKRTDPYALTFTYLCSDCTYYGPVLYVVGYTLPSVTFILYLTIFCRIVAKRIEMRSTSDYSSIANSFKTKDVFLVLQFFFICAIQFGSSGFFYFLPPLTGGAATSYQVSMVFSAMNTMVNPMVIFAFQKRMRTLCFTMLKRILRMHDVFKFRKEVDVGQRS